MASVGSTGGAFAGVAAPPAALAALAAAAGRPVHAYLLVGPAGTGKRAAAAAFAAALLCPSSVAGGDGTCDTCRRVLAGLHPDVTVVEREGPSITVAAAQEVTRLAARSPVEGHRKVLVLDDFHLVREAGPALLKTIEEPPTSTVFVVLAEHVPPELVTIASRCVTVELDPLTPAEIAAHLEADGVSAERAAELAEASGGRLDRAALLASDPGFEARRREWSALPGRLDGTGSTVTALVDALLAQLDSSVGPLEERQARELAALEERNRRTAQVNGKAPRSARGELSAGVKQLQDRHKRELRRHRTDELRAGLGALAGAYRDRLVQAAAGGDPDRRAGAVAAVRTVDRLSADLVHNPGEQLALQALLVRLDRFAPRR